MLPVAPSGINGGGVVADAAMPEAPISAAAIPIAATVSFLKGGPFVVNTGYKPGGVTLVTDRDWLSPYISN